MDTKQLKFNFSYHFMKQLHSCKNNEAIGKRI